MRIHKSLIGFKYGKLKVVKLSHRKNSRIYWECLCECGNTTFVATTNLTRKDGPVRSCGCLKYETMSKLSGDKSPTWKGGRHIDDGGYVRVWHNGRYVREHRLVMSSHLGRELTKNENVHHINGNKQDNRLSNLELWNTSQPAGQRAEDKIAWAKEILELYEK